MRFFAPLVAISAGLSAVLAQEQSLCDKYTTALLNDNTAANQLTVLTLVVNTALIGNYSNGAVPAMNAVTGILNNGTYEGEEVSLLKYFDGSLASTNRDGMATAVNFLDGGGAAPLMNNTPANDMNSNQYMLVTHLYQLFGSLLGCSMMTASGPFMTYQGNPSMSQVHRFMNLNHAQNNYFIQQVGLAATSFGVTSEDATTVGNALNTTFNYRCLPPASLGGGAANASQSTCVASSCPLARNSNCTASAISYPNGTEGSEPVSAASTSSGGGSSGSGGSDGASSLIINAVGALALAAAGFAAVTL